MSTQPEILIAEDEEHIGKLIVFKLTKEGFAVTHARNGQEAINLLTSKDWKLLILDVMMPLADGWQVLKAARENPQTARTPVLVLTAKSIQTDMAKSADLGATQFLKKPFEPAHLAALVKKLVEG